MSSWPTWANGQNGVVAEGYQVIIQSTATNTYLLDIRRVKLTLSFFLLLSRCLSTQIPSSCISLDQTFPETGM
jgi:hypothetical protein